MKTIILYITIIFIITFNNVLPQDPPPCSGLPQPTIYRSNVPGASYVDAELVIYNQTLYWGTERADSIKVRIIPVGALFNGGFEYSPFAVLRRCWCSKKFGEAL
jgi:hypothetical protein